MLYHDLDNAAAAALWMLSRTQNPALEHVGALYSDSGDIARTDTVTSGQHTKVKGSISVPAGALRALFHNHPAIRESVRNVRRSAGGESLSADDKSRARQLGVRSYISTPSGGLRVFDPKANETRDVLAEFPIEEFKDYVDRRFQAAKRTMLAQELEK